MLSSEISTLISGRYIEIPMLPLSFKEYVSSTGEENDLSKKYLSYIENSSSPYAAELAGQPKEIKDYLEGIYNTIVIKDISSRKKVQDTMMLESVARFVFDNIGTPLSTKKIADTMTSDGRKIDVKTVEKYLAGLLESFILYQAKRYNIKGKQYSIRNFNGKSSTKSCCYHARIRINILLLTLFHKKNLSSKKNICSF